MATVKLTDISYEPPDLVKSQIGAWTGILQCVAVVTTLFSGISVQLLGVITADNDVKNKSGPSIALLFFASYAAILFNMITTIGSLFLIDLLADITMNAARKNPPPPREGRVESDSSLQLLRNFDGRPRLTYVFFQWMAYLFVGFGFFFLQIVTYMWVRQNQATSIILTVLTGTAVAGLFLTSYFDMDFRRSP
ncbi:hypothetical protein C8R43DRAFT_1136605 [Mycena crocata]|nr:hypothetical protein C8R43DRAFT_1136605 [Mycena crocata]